MGAAEIRSNIIIIAICSAMCAQGGGGHTTGDNHVGQGGVERAVGSGVLMGNAGGAARCGNLRHATSFLGCIAPWASPMALDHLTCTIMQSRAGRHASIPHGKPYAPLAHGFLYRRYYSVLLVTPYHEEM